MVHIDPTSVHVFSSGNLCLALPSDFTHSLNDYDCVSHLGKNVWGESMGRPWNNERSRIFSF